jgi:hypothetical protein
MTNPLPKNEQRIIIKLADSINSVLVGQPANIVLYVLALSTAISLITTTDNVEHRKLAREFFDAGVTFFSEDKGWIDFINKIKEPIHHTSDTTQ